MKFRGQYRTIILAMLLLATVINYIDRSALSIAMPFVTRDFHLTAGEKGIIFGAFSIGYAVFNFLGGYFADRFGGRRVLTVSMAGWSIACGLTAAVSGFWSMLLVRIAFGMGEGPNASTANKVVNTWFPLGERATAAGISQAGGPIGGALAGPVVGFLALSFGWRAAFLVMAVLGITWAITWRFLATETPAQHPRVNKAELSHIESGQEAVKAPTGQKVSIREVITTRAVLTTGISLFCYNYILFFFITWFPSYLVDAKNISLKDMSLVSSLPWITGAIGFLSGGFLIDAIYRRTGKRMFSRKVVLVTSLLIAAACIALTGVVDSVWTAVGVMTVAIGLLMLAAPAYWAIIQDSVPRHQVGTASGFMHGLANCSGIVGPAITGMLIQTTGSYASAFVLAGAVGLVGSLILAWFVDGTDRALEPEPASVC
ncbi:MFS transporter [Paraburkholderia aspalathi]|uniref:MFS transporter, ACS family, hexuronate transporter n=1 Tax=Paraburkholderia aspalathi TaxID=1324617 RepID=A0A1I6YFK6_9BURK|nr:MFS transporter [Paraburkholderia aspalathi]SFT49319.1 MFS transporter, ACS family, hexuronate transporter [Paraburkholderia aspalathi]